MNIELKKQEEFEKNEFVSRFSKYRNQRIVLYGIGRTTGSLLRELGDFQIVGLMDKNPEKVGTYIYNIPILSCEEAEKTADMIIINTMEIYWKIIYERIKNIKIPVFYKNGELAKLEDDNNESNYYYEKFSCDYLDKKIKEADVVSFDFFDTLFMRAVVNPKDVFAVLDEEYQYRKDKLENFWEKRILAEEKSSDNVDLDGIYERLGAENGITYDLKEYKENELQLEKELLVPRKTILKVLKKVVERKEVYIISDMYLPKRFYTDVLKQYNIDIKEENILLSNELGCSKRSGKLWEFYSTKYLVEKKAVHVGDNLISDVELPEKFKINTIFVPSAYYLLNCTPMRKIIPNVVTNYASSILGCVMGKIFNDPYIQNGKNGKIAINSFETTGYAVFGPVVLTFLKWLEQSKKNHVIKKFVFCLGRAIFFKKIGNGFTNVKKKK